MLLLPEYLNYGEGVQLVRYWFTSNTILSFVQHGYINIKFHRKHCRSFDKQVCLIRNALYIDSNCNNYEMLPTPRFSISRIRVGASTRRYLTTNNDLNPFTTQL